MRTLLGRYHQENQSHLPPFQGGLAGLISYDFSRQLESLPSPREVDLGLPQLLFGFYDVVIGWDHVERRCWLISQGFPERGAGRRSQRAQLRAAEFERLLCGELSSESELPMISDVGVGGMPLASQAPALARRVPGREGLFSSFSPGEYEAAVERALEYIRAGDVYQVNLAQRLLCRATTDSMKLFERLCQLNPAPFAAWFDLGGAQIASCSPERLVAVRQGEVETRPIKGTRRQTGVPQHDWNVRRELEASSKDRAENVMIVDLLRNDLSRVCEDDSVRVSQLLQPEVYRSVVHLVSAIRGRLRNDCDVWDLLAAIFPGGSITGAPKIRAMEIISELEPVARGAYCGALGYIGCDGTADWNILIRTITACDGWWHLPVGGGIVALSTAEEEYRETWTKAAAMLRAIQRAAP